ncbi:hypothetical protein BBW65_07745 [Helicobacter enhydrae]|nr:lipid A-modifier LpxR family protein [Helicobacter enhydrae]ANV98694.1 hypothetical protein BBW65_07745 [Helicobacter enhydrae]
MFRIIIGLCVASIVWAQHPYKKHFVSFVTQNDGYVFPMIDRYYTAGHSLLYASAEESGGGIIGWIDGNHSFNLAISQSIYTAKSKFATTPSPQDHRYASFMTLSAFVTNRNLEWLENIGLLVGVGGKWSFGQEVQNGIHQMMGVGLANGWGTQIADEWVANLYYDLTYRY